MLPFLNVEVIISNICVERLYKIDENGELVYSDNRNWDIINSFLQKNLKLENKEIDLIDWNPFIDRLPNNILFRDDLKGFILKDLHSFHFENYASALIVYCGNNGFIDKTSNFEIIEEVLKARAFYKNYNEKVLMIDLWLKWAWGKLSKEHKEILLRLNAYIIRNEVGVRDLIYYSFGHLFSTNNEIIGGRLKRISEKYNFSIELKVIDTLLINDRDNYLCIDSNGIIFHKGKVIHL